MASRRSDPARLLHFLRCDALGWTELRHRQLHHRALTVCTEWAIGKVRQEWVGSGVTKYEVEWPSFSTLHCWCEGSVKLIFLKLHMLFRGYARSTHDICDMHNICYVTMIPTLCHKDMFLNATNLSLCVLDALIFSPFCCKQGPTFYFILLLSKWWYLFSRLLPATGKNMW